MKSFTWRIGGEAGFGIVSSGEAFARCFSRYGLGVFVKSDYPSVIRGGHNIVDVRISDKPIFTHERKVDILAALDKETILLHSGELKDGGHIIYDPEAIKLFEKPRGAKLIEVPLSRIVREFNGIDVMRNMIILGSSLAIMGMDFMPLEFSIFNMYKDKGREVIDKNINMAKEGYKHVIKNHGRSSPMFRKTRERKMLISGNGAICMGAIKAGCKFVSEYPMTPSSSILNWMADHEKKFNIVVKQTEDEIAAMGMAIGASFGGVRSMTATSGGGFSLMVEGLGLAGMAEIPVVIVEAQRPGPSTGLPTWTEQSDLKFIINASQGEFPRIVVAPGDAEEAFHEMFNAFNIAEKYQLPVVIVSDKSLSEGYSAVNKFNTNDMKVDRGKFIGYKDTIKSGEYKRYEFTQDGVSTRSIPGNKKTLFTSTGNEHDEDGMITEDPDIRTKMMNKRFKKLVHAARELPDPKLYGHKDPKATLICWGSNKWPCMEALGELDKMGVKANMVHFLYIHPFPRKFTEKVIAKSHNTILVENNKTGQLGSLIKENTGFDVDHRILKYDGRPFDFEEIAKEVKRYMDGKV